MKYLFIFLFSIMHFIAPAQKPADVLHYRFSLQLNDHNDSIQGKADIVFIPVKGSPVFEFGLAGVNEQGKGMFVTGVRLSDNGKLSDTTGISFIHQDNKLRISRFTPPAADDTLTATIEYKGIPADGLIISRSKFGQRTFFSDNWPDRAHHWIPCVDDPADKASVEFIVTAPEHYEVVSNGVLEEERRVPGGNKLSHWKEVLPLPTKIMVIGVANFAIDTLGDVKGVPVTSWVFPENKKDGFYDYGQAKEVLAWFIEYMGPFPYRKLANVQSKTIFGGMENAGAIFYNQDYVTGERKEERLFAHEITHQWFGDMVTEKNFSHLWLSEGFATCLANMYLESKYGKVRLRQELEEDRQQVIDFANNSDRPVVDTVSPYMQLLNANSYQKGGWVLHMLRREVGDSMFHLIVRKFYEAYAGKNADTRDFQKICERYSGKDLSVFFRQWLYEPGYPSLDIKWQYETNTGQLQITVSQLQPGLFRFPLEIGVRTVNGDTLLYQMMITKKDQSFRFPAKAKVTGIVADPNTSLLFEGRVSRKN